MCPGEQWWCGVVVKLPSWKGDEWEAHENRSHGSPWEGWGKSEWEKIWYTVTRCTWSVWHLFREISRRPRQAQLIGQRACVCVLYLCFQLKWRRIDYFECLSWTNYKRRGRRRRGSKNVDQATTGRLNISVTKCNKLHLYTWIDEIIHGQVLAINQNAWSFVK